MPEIPEGLAQLYSKLNWTAERSVTLKDLAARFPRNPRVLQEVLEVLEDEGRHLEADRIAARIKTLDPDSEIEVDRALARHDYPAAIAELRRLGQRRPDRKDIADRIVEVTMRSGDPSGVLSPARAPRRQKAARSGPAPRPRRRQIRRGGQASRCGTASPTPSWPAGARPSFPTPSTSWKGRPSSNPIASTARKIVKDYETSGAEMEGTAARVLDYSSLWIHPDGSSRMLEHELIRIQSQEAIGKMAEQRVPDGLLLRMRVIKKDGTILEPEFVDGKKTVTMPHLEIGDYIETENIANRGGDGQLGRRYLGPHWFFREADVGYWRSEFVVISPKDKPLVVETRGEVPPPSRATRGPSSFGAGASIAALLPPTNPASAPIQEFLPSVRIGWGISLNDHLRRLADAASDELPRDPRLVRIASQIVAGESSDSAKARKLYRWLLANVEDGRESDGRRVVVGKSGNRAAGFIYLCRTLGIPVELAASKDKLNPPPLGPISEAEQFDDFIIRVGGKTPEWLTLRDKYAPYGYLPAGLRGQPAYRLVAGTPRETTAVEGTADGIIYEGTGELRADGTAVARAGPEISRSPGHGAARGARTATPGPAARRHRGQALGPGHPRRAARQALDRESSRSRSTDRHAHERRSDRLHAPPRSRSGARAPVCDPHVADCASSAPANAARARRADVRVDPPFVQASARRARRFGPRRRSKFSDRDRRVVVRDRQEGQNLVLDRDHRHSRWAHRAFGLRRASEFRARRRRSDDAGHRHRHRQVTASRARADQGLCRIAAPGALGAAAAPPPTRQLGAAGIGAQSCVEVVVFRCLRHRVPSAAAPKAPVDGYGCPSVAHAQLPRAAMGCGWSRARRRGWGKWLVRVRAPYFFFAGGGGGRGVRRRLGAASVFFEAICDPLPDGGVFRVELGAGIGDFYALGRGGGVAFAAGWVERNCAYSSQPFLASCHLPWRSRNRR